MLKVNKFLDFLNINNYPQGCDLELKHDFRKIYSYRELPLHFPIEDTNELFRYSAEFYGAVFTKQFRNYSLWMTLGLKNNVSVLVTLFFNFFSKNAYSKVKGDSWNRYSYVYYNSYNKDYKDLNYYVHRVSCLDSLNFNYVNKIFDFSDVMLDIISDHKFNHCMNTSSLDLDCSVSSYILYGTGFL